MSQSSCASLLLAIGGASRESLRENERSIGPVPGPDIVLLLADPRLFGEGERLDRPVTREEDGGKIAAGLRDIRVFGAKRLLEQRQRATILSFRILVIPLRLQDGGEIVAG